MIYSQKMLKETKKDIDLIEFKNLLEKGLVSIKGRDEGLGRGNRLEGQTVGNAHLAFGDKRTEVPSLPEAGGGTRC